VFGLKLAAVRHRYGTQTVLSVERFEVAAGEHWLVLGPSGCGKTTLLHVIAGLLRPSEGEVEVAGQALAALSGAALDRWRGRTIGIALQAQLKPLGRPASRRPPTRSPRSQELRGLVFRSPSLSL